LHGYNKRVVFCGHHESHAASAFFPSPFEEAAILTVDGVGEWTTAAVGTGRGRHVELKQELRFPHSLGLLYSAVTAFCGFEVNDGEYKLMGLAPYGEPVYRDLILEKLIDLKADGSLRLDMRYFDFCHGLRMTSRRFAKLFGMKPRRPESEITQPYMNLAASIQAVSEEVMLRMATHAHRMTGMKNLVLAGGVGLNCVANSKLLREGPFERIWVQPAAGDDGGALGVAMLIWHQLLGNQRAPEACDSQRGSLLGPAYDDDAIREMLDIRGEAYETADDDQQLCNQTAALLAEGNVVGWFQGRMEYGPRALGARSILADPRDPGMQARLNAAVKDRESFRPFAPAVPAEKAGQYYELAAEQPYAYMLITARSLAPQELPAVTHVDGSARVQTVDRERFPLFHRLLQSFDALTECPVLVNTSFNVRGEPIVCSPDDAYRCFLQTDLDALVMGRHIVRKQSIGDRPAAKPRMRPRSRWIHLEIQWHPTTRQLWRFALAVGITLPTATLLWHASWTWVTAAAVVSLLLLIAAKWFPAALLVLYRALLVVTLPVLLLVNEVLLAGIYYGVLTPVGLALRTVGHRGLALSIEKTAESYWQPAVSVREAIRYFRQS